MQHSFHSRLVQNIFQRFGNDIHDICIVFPTRRAKLFFSEALQKIYSQTIWLPSMYSIDDWVREQYVAQFPEKMELVFELYAVFIEVMRRRKPTFVEDIDSFYNWGEIILDDFDEIDKYQVDARQLYATLQDYKELETSFGIAEDVLEELRIFLDSFNKEQLSEIQDNFLQLWESLFHVYTEFKKRLIEKKWAYEGMAYSSLAQQIQAGEVKLPYRHIVFAGLNQLSLSEQQIIEFLLKEGRASIYWDSIPYQSKKSSPVLEKAFQYVIRFHTKWKSYESHLFETDFHQESRSISIVGVPHSAAQARYVGEEIQAKLQSEFKDLRQNAIVMADEQLLFPLIYNLPENVSAINITMGFPLRVTHVYQLIVHITRLIKENARKGAFYYRNVQQILQNPMIQSLAPVQSRAILDTVVNKNMVYISSNYLEKEGEHTIIALIFTPVRDTYPLFEYLENIFLYLIRNIESAGWKIESEYVYYLYLRFNLFRTILARYPDLSLDLLMRLLRNTLRNVKIPFQGVPLEGLQILGMLETRTLDFESVYIVGANEGNLPQDVQMNSFIPKDLRKYYHLPTDEEKTQAATFHFYRLLLRTKEMHLVYNSEVKSAGNTGEPSRFIRQIQHIFPPTFYPNITISEKQYFLPAQNIASNEISILSNPDFLAFLKQRFDARNPENKFAFSLTSLTTYLSCPLRFYFQYVAGFKAKEEVSEGMDDREFGIIAHQVIERLYKPYLHQNLSEAFFDSLIPCIPAVIEVVFNAFQEGILTDLSGENYIKYQTLHGIIQQLILQDKELWGNEPFVIESIEDKQELRTSIALPSIDVEVSLVGSIDRLDRLTPQRVRIVDYKTGRVELKADKSKNNEAFDDHFSVAASEVPKTVLQGYMYGYLFHKKHPNQEAKVGFYALKKTKQGLIFINDGEAISQATCLSFEENLIALLMKIFTEPFTQTPHTSTCLYCDFAQICNRKEKEAD